MIPVRLKKVPQQFVAEDKSREKKTAESEEKIKWPIEEITSEEVRETAKSGIFGWTFTLKNASS